MDFSSEISIFSGSNSKEFTVRDLIYEISNQSIRIGAYLLECNLLTEKQYRKCNKSISRAMAASTKENKIYDENTLNETVEVAIGFGPTFDFTKAIAIIFYKPEESPILSKIISKFDKSKTKTIVKILVFGLFCELSIDKCSSIFKKFIADEIEVQNEEDIRIGIWMMYFGYWTFCDGIRLGKEAFLENALIIVSNEGIFSRLMEPKISSEVIK